MKKVHLNIVLGTIFTLISVLILIVMAAEEEDRLVDYEAQQIAAQIEFGAAVFSTNCTACHGDYAQGIPGKAPCLRCSEFFESRLAEVGWSGSLENYIINTVSGGRQISTRPGLYQGEGQGPPVMPAWSDEFDGPLRKDQIRAVAAFIANFEQWAVEPDLVPTPLVALDPDDPVAIGRVLMTQYGCTGCHTVEGVSTATTGPVLNGIATRGESQEGYASAEEYIRDSILNPSAVVVGDFNDGVMPANFSELISDENLGHIVAFLLTLTDE